MSQEAKMRSIMQHSFSNPGRHCGGLKLAKPVEWRAVGSPSWTTCPSIRHTAWRLGMSVSTVSRYCHANAPFRGYELRFGEFDVAHVEGEEWRHVLDPNSGQKVPGRLVSSHGRLKFQSGRISFGKMQNHGYLSTTYTLASMVRAELVHRLVAAAFLGKRPGPAYSQINHKDGNKQNNTAENLEYVTPAENNAPSRARARRCSSKWSETSGKQTLPE